MSDATYLEILRKVLPPFLAIYRVNALPPAEEVFLVTESNVRLSLQAGPIEFSYSLPRYTYKPPSAALTEGLRQVRLPSDCYLVLDIQFQQIGPRDALQQATLKAAEAVTLFDLRYPELVAEKIYEGFVRTPNSMLLISEGPMRLTAQPVLNVEAVAAEVASDLEAVTQLQEDIRQRFQLAARWFRRGQEATNPIDKFLFWWTVLEIYPGEGSTNMVKKLSDFLVDHLDQNLNPGQVKSKVEIGRLYGLRKEIVHRGKAFVEPEKSTIFLDYVQRLHAMASTCLRILAGLRPGHDLDKYLSS